jgi:hypothetical protein
MFLVSVQPTKESNIMNSFVQPSYPTHHEGIERVGVAIDSAKKAYRNFDSARGIATFLLAAVVSGLLFAANQAIDTWADGHLLAAWVALWAVAFAAMALAATPIRRAALSLKNIDGSAMYAAWSARRKARIADEYTLECARQDHRLMAEITRAADTVADAAPKAAASYARTNKKAVSQPAFGNSVAKEWLVPNYKLLLTQM